MSLSLCLMWSCPFPCVDDGWSGYSDHLDVSLCEVVNSDDGENDDGVDDDDVDDGDDDDDGVDDDNDDNDDDDDDGDEPGRVLPQFSRLLVWNKPDLI